MTQFERELERFYKASNKDFEEQLKNSKDENYRLGYCAGRLNTILLIREAFGRMCSKDLTLRM